MPRMKASTRIMRMFLEANTATEPEKPRRGGARTGAGRPPGSRLEPGERAQVVSFTLSPKLVAKLAAEAERKGRSRSLIVEEALKVFLK